ncbi:MAG TPA: amino acid ABC transporter substrate-binding protein [Phototrophicaceae bacterium]|nr:amino acid ABC transporter substrate-binding protein [Phototrophicaceae bacterium]
MKVFRSLMVVVTVLVLLASLGGMVSAQVEPTGKLAEVLARGKLICGTNGTLPGFSFLNADTGEITGFDADYCRAVAAAIFGEVTADNLQFVTVTPAERFAALQSGQIDVLFANATSTFSRDTDLRLDAGPVIFYDGQGLMVRTSLGVASIDDLGGASFCTLTGTTTELNITDAMKSRGLEFELIPFETSTDSFSGFEAERCDVITSDKSQLASLRSSANDPSQYLVLPDTLSKEPLAPFWLEGDEQWGNVIRWTVYATFQAEELGLTSATIETADVSNPTISRFIGNEGGLGGFLGLSDDFAVKVIKAVGNYGEIYDRHITPIGIDRAGTLNAAYTEGGLIYAPAWR